MALPCRRAAFGPTTGVSATRLGRIADLAAVAGRIAGMRKDRPATKSDVAQPPALPKDESRVEMMRRVKGMSVEQRVELFERLSRDAAWARSANRVR